MREKQILRDSLDQDCMDINNRLDKLNLDRMNDLGDIQGKIALFGKSAQRHLDALKHFVVRECQNLFDLATKPASVVFDAFRYTLQLSRIDLTYQEQAIVIHCLGMSNMVLLGTYFAIPSFSLTDHTKPLQYQAFFN